MMRESAQITSIVDAFDGKDPFDAHLSLGFQQTWQSGKILRESASGLPQLSSGNYTAGNLSVAKYSESTSRLNTRVDLGIYKDISLTVRMPIILSNDRKLDSLNGSAANQALILQGAPGEQLFSIPFESPTRSGIEYLALGLNLGLMNQTRDRAHPTWVFGIEGRFNVSEPMHACRGSSDATNPGLPVVYDSQGNPVGPAVADGQVDCAYPSDLNRDGESGQYDVNGVELEGTNFSGSRDPGVSRGTTGLRLNTFLSKRIRYVEPYGGIEALFEFQTDSSDFGTTDLQGALVNHPPFQGSLVAGLEVIPWEIPDNFQRVALDFRLTGTYRSEGRDYSPLFDAIGSSDAPSLRRPNFATFQSGPDGTSVPNTSSQKVYTTGITDVQQHGIYTAAMQVTFQAGQYVKFNLGTAFTATQGHIITFDQPCNPDFSGDVGAAGPCRSGVGDDASATGIPNPNYRPVLDVPGRRFRFDDATAFDLWLNATVMF